MKFYEYVKRGDYCRIKFCGITLYKQMSDYMSSLRRQLFLGGFISTCKKNEDFGNLVEKDIKIFGKVIFKRIDDGKFRNWYFANKLVKSHDLKEVIKRACFKYLDKSYDDIYVLNANSGEIYVFLTYVFSALLKKNGSKKPLLLATKRYHCALCRMICPDVVCKYVPNFARKIVQNTFTIDNFRFFMVFEHVYFKKVEAEIKNKPAGEVHYFDLMLERCGLTREDISMRCVKVIDEDLMLEKVKNINLNLDKFVFIAPEAKSCGLLDNKFWVELINEYNNSGYDVFVNLISNNVDLTGCEFKSCFLTYSEAFALAKRAKKIVSLRSGFTECLLQTDVEIDIIYNKFSNRKYVYDMTLEQVAEGFAINKLPNVNHEKIREFKYGEFTVLDIINGKRSVK